MRSTPTMRQPMAAAGATRALVPACTGWSYIAFSGVKNDHTGRSRRALESTQ